MDQLSRSPRGALMVGILTATIVAAGVFVLHAPGWILVPIGLAGATMYAELGFWVDRRLRRRH